MQERIDSPPGQAQAAQPSGPGGYEAQVRAYHQLSMHRPDASAPGPGGLDWSNQPDPFRRYAGCRQVPLWQRPLGESPARELVLAGPLDMPSPLNDRSLSQCLYDSLALSAWKEAGGNRWALRVNPSSGNLHPTEAYLLLPPGVCGEAALLAHYRPDEHVLEVRAELPPALGAKLARALPAGGFLLALSSIGWREAWKYGERSWRYCQLDDGHAQAAIALAAGALGWQVRTLETLDEISLDTLFGLDRAGSHEHEQIDCLLWVGTPQAASFELPASLVRGMADLSLIGEPNTLSPQYRQWPAQEQMLDLCRAPRRAPAAWPQVEGLRTWSSPQQALRPLLHQRRSAQAFDGQANLGCEQFVEILQRLLAENTPLVLGLDGRAPQVDLLLFVHRVQGLAPGLYWLDRTATPEAERRAALRDSFLWEHCGFDLPLYRLQAGDARGLSGFLSCGQAIAADSCFALAMLARMDAALAEGPWAYAGLYRECGRLGQLLYLEAEAAGLSGTGIGCFFDPVVHELLDISDSRWQSLYHFTLGRALWDERLTSLPAYESLRWPPLAAEPAL